MLVQGAVTNGLIAAFLGGIAAVICVTDFSKMIIPDWINAVLAVMGAAVSILVFKQDWFVVLGTAAFTGVFFIVLAESYRRLRGVSGLGMGDVKFLAAASTWIVAWVMPKR